MTSLLLAILSLLLAIIATASAANYCFPTRDELKAAIDLYIDDDCANITSNCSTYFVASSIGYPMNDWCTSNVTDMSNLFDNKGTFNEDISNWDVSSVTTFDKMFWYAYQFDSDLSNWDTSSAVDMQWMFGRAQRFNGDISSWSTSSVTNMQGMFYYAMRFNSDISSWDVSKVENMYGMFIGASSFNQDLSSWNTESLTSSENMFQEATSFDLNNAPKLPTLKPTLVPTRNPTQQPTTSSPTTSNPTVSPTIDTSNCYMLDISIRLDQYPVDTRWEIIPKGQKGAVATSPTYDSSMQNQAVEVESICLEEGTYDFIIYDVYGDGICCDWGEGYYRLAFNGDIVANGGSFGKAETKTFNTPTSPSKLPSNITTTITSASPTSDSLSTKEPTELPSLSPQTISISGSPTTSPSYTSQTKGPSASPSSAPILVESSASGAPSQSPQSAIPDPTTTDPTATPSTKMPTFSPEEVDTNAPVGKVSGLLPEDASRDDELEDADMESCPNGYSLGGRINNCRICESNTISCDQIRFTDGDDAFFSPDDCACTLCESDYQCNFLGLDNFSPNPLEMNGDVIVGPPPNPYNPYKNGGLKKRTGSMINHLLVIVFVGYFYI